VSSIVTAKPPQRDYRIGFISTRFAGTDGVSLEAEKWASVLERLGHTCFYFAGLSDRPEERSYVVPEALFTHTDISFIYIESFTQRYRPPRVSSLVTEIKDHLKQQLEAFVRQFDIDLLIAENCLTIPMNIPLGIALTEFIAETGIPTIAHHHDFYWERDRYLLNCVADYLSMAFPPRLPSILHVVINSIAGNQMSLRTGNSSMLIPNVMDFHHPPEDADDYVTDLRRDLGIQPGERFFLQPTRVVQRKGIEHALELTKRLGIPARLIISHASGDERDDYEKRVRDYASMLHVPVNFVADIIQYKRGETDDGRKIYSLEDVFIESDLVTYPSTIEGFGNAFLEAIYFRKPIVVNGYSIYDVDIKPKGFRVVEFQGYITDNTVRQTQEVLEDQDLRHEIVEHNFELGKRFYSYAVLERHLKTLITDAFGEHQPW
jgi:mannosylglucosylglycerate synthase